MSHLVGNIDGNSVDSKSNGASAMSVTSLPLGIPSGNYPRPDEYPRTSGFDFTREMEAASAIASTVGSTMARAASNTFSILRRGIAYLKDVYRDFLNTERKKKLENKHILQDKVQEIEDMNNAIYNALDGGEYVLVLNCAELNEELSSLTEDEGREYMAQCQANNLTTAAGNLNGFINEAFRLYQKGLGINDSAIKTPNVESRIYYLIELMFTETGPTYRTDVHETEIIPLYRTVTRWRDQLMQGSADAVELGRMIPLMEEETTFDNFGVERRKYPSNPPPYIMPPPIGPNVNFQGIYESGTNPNEYFPSKGSLAYQRKIYDESNNKRDKERAKNTYESDKEGLKRILEERYRRENKTLDELKLEQEAKRRLKIANKSKTSKNARDEDINKRRSYGGKKRKTHKKHKKNSHKNKKRAGKNKRSNKRQKR